MTHRLVAASDASAHEEGTDSMIPEPVRTINYEARVGEHECFVCGERKPITLRNSGGVLLPLCVDCAAWLRAEERRAAEQEPEVA